MTVDRPAHSVMACSANVESMTASQLETALSHLTSEQLISWMRERARGWEPIPLQLKLKPGQKPYAKPHMGYSTPAGLVPSMQYMLEDQCAKGYMRKVAFSDKLFVSQGFCQAKPGRFFPGTNLPMVRLLADCRNLNAACVDAHLHHYDSCPTQAGMSSQIPFGSQYFRY